jgi:ABC-type branched-subunit amino acid transport system ATPase component
MLKFENVSTFYGKIQALHSVNVESTRARSSP